MNMYDEACEIRLAKWEDIPEIMDFVEKEWRHGHILGRDRAFFEYEHASGGVVNFIIARNRETGRLDGMLGFLPASSCPDCLDLWTVMWKTRPGCVPLLGLELMNRVDALTGCRYALGIGDNPKTTVPLLRRTDPEIKIFRLEHYYLPDDRENFRIAKIAYRPETGEISGEEPQVCRLVDAAQTAEYIDFSDTSVVPYKDEGYLDHRFFRHPVYDYRVYGLRQGAASALLVTRVRLAGRSALFCRPERFLPGRDESAGLRIHRFLCVRISGRFPDPGRIRENPGKRRKRHPGLLPSL